SAQRAAMTGSTRPSSPRKAADSSASMRPGSGSAMARGTPSTRPTTKARPRANVPGSRMLASSTSDHDTTSCDLAMRPSLRASRFFLGVGFSVLSLPDTSPPHEAGAVAHHVLDERGHGVAEERQGEGAEHQHQHDLHGEAEDHDVAL